MGRDLVEIAMALIGVATIALFVGNASGATSVIQAIADGFNKLLRTVSLQSN